METKNIKELRDNLSINYEKSDFGDFTECLDIVINDKYRVQTVGLEFRSDLGCLVTCDFSEIEDCELYEELIDIAEKWINDNINEEYVGDNLYKFTFFGETIIRAQNEKYINKYRSSYTSRFY